MKPGIYKNLDMDKYHADSALSRSDIVRLNQSPVLFKNHIDEDKPAYRLGRAFHSQVLQGIKPVVNPNDLRTNKGKEFQTEHPDALSEKDMELCQKMAKKVKPFFVEGEAEVSYFWNENGISRKCRPDWISQSVIWDLKTTARNLEDFHYDAYKFCYDLQHVWYVQGIEQYQPVSTFRFVVVQKQEPHRVGLFEFENLDRANEMIERGLSVYGKCMLTDVWEDPPVEICYI